MKTIFLISFLLVSIVSFGQVQGGQRICGSEFSKYGLEGKTLTEALDWAGQTHNDYQESMLQKLSIIKPNFTDTIALKTIISQNSAPFFSAKGLAYNENVHTLNLGKTFILEVKPGAYSRDGFNLMSQLKSKLDSYDPNNDAEFFSTLRGLKESALNLADEKEAFTVGVPISVAINSLTYWKANGQKWLDIFTSYDQPINNNSSPTNGMQKAESGPGKPKVSLSRLATADVSGAISGAIGGAVLGPGGAVAMGVLGSATSSLGNLAGQVISHFISSWF